LCSGIQGNKDAARTERIKDNPADKVVLPKTETFQGVSYTKQLLALTIMTKFEIPVLLGVWFGMCRGEICGVKWDAIDFEKMTLENGATLVDVRHFKNSQNRSVLRHENQNRDTANKHLVFFLFLCYSDNTVKPTRQKSYIVCGDDGEDSAVRRSPERAAERVCENTFG
jgi:integrase